MKVIPQTALTSAVKSIVPPNVTIQAPPTTQSEGQGQSSPAIHVMTAVTKPAATMTTSVNVKSPVTVLSTTQAGGNPLVARLVQQMSAGKFFPFTYIPDLASGPAASGSSVCTFCNLYFRDSPALFITLIINCVGL